MKKKKTIERKRESRSSEVCLTSAMNNFQEVEATGFLKKRRPSLLPADKQSDASTHTR